MAIAAPLSSETRAQPVDMAVALVQHTRSLELPKMRDWQVLVEATGYGALLQELHDRVTHHMCGVVQHWATMDVLPTWLEEAAESGGREGYLGAWRSKLEEEGWFRPNVPDRRESALQESRRNLLGGSFEMMIRASHAAFESQAPVVIDEVHDAWVRETLQAARPVTTPGGHILDNVPIGQNTMHAKREHEVFKRLRWLYVKLAVDEDDVLRDRPYHGSVYALPCRARELEVEATVRLLLQSRDALRAVEAREDANVAAVRKELAETILELEVERDRRIRREATERREAHNRTSEHNAAMLREAQRAREEEVKAVENQIQLATSMCDMHAAKARYEAQHRVYEEAAASSEEQREALRVARRTILDLRKMTMDANAKVDAAAEKAEEKAAEMARENAVLKQKVADLESNPGVVRLGLNISAVDDVALNDAAREARKTATREAEIRHEQQTMALRRRCNEQDAHIERLVRGVASNAEKSDAITRLTAEVEAGAATAMRAKQAQGEAERRAAAAEDEADQLRSKLRAERETSSSLSDRWAEEVEKLREDNRAMRVKMQAGEALAGVAGAWEKISVGKGGDGNPAVGGSRQGAGDVVYGNLVAPSPQQRSDLVLAARAVVVDRSGDEAMRIVARNKELEAAVTAMEARERVQLERLAEAEAANATQRERAGAVLLKAQAALDAAASELTAAEARAATAEAAVEAERQRVHVAIKEQTSKTMREMTHEKKLLKMHKQMLTAIHEKRLADMEAQVSEAFAARERDEMMRAFKEADDRLKAFMNVPVGVEGGKYADGTMRLKLETEAIQAANAVRQAAPQGNGNEGASLTASHDPFRPKGSDAAVAAVMDVAELPPQRD